MNPKIEVGPVGNGQYAYRVDGKVSVHRYANRASAQYNAMRPQKIRDDGFLEPDQLAEDRAERKAA
jgi:hypothetical protein